MQPGPSVSLKCSATGNPTPQIVWNLDGFPLPNVSRFFISFFLFLLTVSKHIVFSEKCNKSLRISKKLLGNEDSVFYKFYFLEGSLFSLILARLESVVCCMFSCGLNDGVF